MSYNKKMAITYVIAILNVWSFYQRDIDQLLSKSP